MADKRLAIFDGNGIVYAAAAANRLSTEDGRQTGGIHGGIQSLKAAALVVRPTAVIVVWDSPDGADRRRRIYPHYKNRRYDSPEVSAFRKDLTAQMDVADAILRSLGVLTLRVPGYEADDVIAALALMFKPDESVIVSNDKDFGQLVDEHISLYLVARRKTITNTNFGMFTRDILKAKKLVTRNSLPLFRALTGDDSDTIPGIPGIGPVLAAKYVEGCTMPEDLLDKHHDNKGKKVQSMLENIGMIRTYMEIMNLRQSLEDEELVDGIRERLTPPTPDNRKLLALTTEYELNTIRSHMQSIQRAFRVI